MAAAEYKKAAPADQLTDEHWESQVRTHLFKSKRALELANLLSARQTFRQFFPDKPTRDGLLKLVEDRAGRDAIAKVVRRAKADRVGTAMADLTICGAVPPYNEILGGKLVAMLLVGPEVMAEYRRRYGSLPSVIASSMAGRAIQRRADLVFIGTTSLYGQRPSQYDRIAIPADPDGPAGGPGLRYEYLGRTRGIGTLHFNPRTVSELDTLLAQSAFGQRVNSVFGEGSNPRLRKIRDGLDLLGLPADELLQHGGPRLVYGVELADNTREYLLGREQRPRYILDGKDPRSTTDRIARWWARRWLVHRLEKPEVLERVGRHTLVHPIRHGARVPLPPDPEQGELFE
jgi:hypothetical protein